MCCSISWPDVSCISMNIYRNLKWGRIEKRQIRTENVWPISRIWSRYRIRESFRKWFNLSVWSSRMCMHVWGCVETYKNIHTHKTLRIPSLKRLCIVYNRIWINLTKLLVKIFIMSSRIFYWGLRSSHWVNVYCVRFQCFFFPNFMYAHSSAHSICVRLLSVCLLAATETWWVLKFSRCACD